MTKKLVYGVGINDADYNVQTFITIEGQKKFVEICPFYRRWRDMLGRCYSEKYHSKYPSYIGCLVTPEWHYFMNFRAWMIEQDWKGKHLDKDILFPGNKIYGPETCVFVDPKVNLFLTDCASSRGEFPVGVSYHKPSGKFIARCRDVQAQKEKHLGLFEDPMTAHDTWRVFKYAQAAILANEQTDPRVAQALLDRYKL